MATVVNFTLQVVWAGLLGPRPENYHLQFLLFKYWHRVCETCQRLILIFRINDTKEDI